MAVLAVLAVTAVTAVGRMPLPEHHPLVVMPLARSRRRPARHLAHPEVGVLKGTVNNQRRLVQLTSSIVDRNQPKLTVKM